MGGGTYSSVSHTEAVKALDDSGKAFARSSRAVSSGDITGNIAAILDPLKLKNGMRESCFAPGFNDAMPIVISIDGTGSMHDVPRQIQQELPKLIDLLLEQGVTDHPNVMYICHDDETVVSRAAFQMSQFEITAPTLVTALNEMVIPGQGGGNDGESYHLTFYALAHHTRLEAFERDGTKGFLFMICDEQPYFDRGDPNKRGTTPEIAKSVFGDVIEREVSMLESLRKTCERYHVFIIRPGHTSHGANASITRMWQKLLKDAGENPEHVLEVAETEAIISTIALAIGRLTGASSDDLVDVLRSKGAAGVDAASAATTALVASAGAALVAKASSAVVTSDEKSSGRSRRA